MDMQALELSTHEALEAAFADETPILLATIAACVGKGVRYGIVTRRCVWKLEQGASVEQVWTYVHLFEKDRPF